jgi:hypothetical protein
VFKAKTIGRCNNVFAPVCSVWRHLCLVAHGSQDACDDLLHLFPAQIDDEVLDLLSRTFLNATQWVNCFFFYFVCLYWGWLAL